MEVGKAVKSGEQRSFRPSFGGNEGANGLTSAFGCPYSDMNLGREAAHQDRPREQTQTYLESDSSDPTSENLGNSNFKGKCEELSSQSSGDSGITRLLGLMSINIGHFTADRQQSLLASDPGGHRQSDENQAGSSPEDLQFYPDVQELPGHY